MRVVETGRRCQNNEIHDVLLHGRISLEVEAAKLWDKELKVAAESWSKVRVDSDPLKVWNGMMIMSVESYQDGKRIYFSIPILMMPVTLKDMKDSDYKSDPFLEARYELILWDSCPRWFTAKTAAAQVVATAA